MQLSSGTADAYLLNVQNKFIYVFMQDAKVPG
jgi:hypothetical protein